MLPASLSNLLLIPAHPPCASPLSHLLLIPHRHRIYASQESDSDEETPVTIDVSGIDAGLLLSDTAGIVCSGEGHNIMQNGCEDPKSVLYNATVAPECFIRMLAS